MAPEAEPLKVQGSLSPPCRYPVLAALLSAIFPGLGQWYNGERIKAFAIGCMSIGTYVGILLAIIGPKGHLDPSGHGCVPAGRRGSHNGFL
ncbi:MAG: hypothetical protein HYY57_00755 [Candidatus Omnitrophica bacterium]|nr:hypothetical protein [Candidatus Omnitrophota bacterium]